MIIYTLSTNSKSNPTTIELTLDGPEVAAQIDTFIDCGYSPVYFKSNDIWLFTKKINGKSKSISLRSVVFLISHLLATGKDYGHPPKQIKTVNGNQNDLRLANMRKV
jgi:hypothetical protein